MSHIPIEYIWFGGNNEFRSKIRYFQNIPVKELKHHVLQLQWNYDGSSTNQATTDKSEIILKPVQVYSNISNTKYYVLCETYSIDGEPLSNNYRYALAKFLEKPDIEAYKIWFGFEQEFFIYDLTRKTILGFNTNGQDRTPSQGPFYCNIEAVSQSDHDRTYLSSTAPLRAFTEEIAKACVDLSLGITGWNLEVAPGQTEVQIFGHDIKACDDLMMFRFLCHIILNQHNMRPDFSPKPLGLLWNGSGLHTNISTQGTRESGGYDLIIKYMTAFEKTHKDHMAVYGKDNHLRLTGIHETSSIDKFTWGIASRSSSVRIPRETAQNNCGYFEDRRPAANANPYQISLRVLQTISEYNS